MTTKIGRRRELADKIKRRLRTMLIPGTFHAGAVEHDRRDVIQVWFNSHGLKTDLTPDEAAAYLAYLEAGHTGEPWEWRKNPNPPLHRYPVTGRLTQDVTVEVEASSPGAARIRAGSIHSRAWMLTPDGMDGTVVVNGARAIQEDADTTTDATPDKDTEPPC